MKNSHWEISANRCFIPPQIYPYYYESNNINNFSIFQIIKYASLSLIFLFINSNNNIFQYFKAFKVSEIRERHRERHGRNATLWNEVCQENNLTTKLKKFRIHKSLKKKLISTFTFNFNIHDRYYKYSYTLIFMISKNIFEYLYTFLINVKKIRD